MAKAKQTKHTSAEIKSKERAANANKGGGKDGLADRKGGKAGHAKYKCPSCGIQVRALNPMLLRCFTAVHSLSTIRYAKALASVYVTHPQHSLKAAFWLHSGGRVCWC